MARIKVPMPIAQKLSELIAKEPTEQLREVASLSLELLLDKKYEVTDSQGRYLHWNDFQWRVEQRDSVNVAWLATRFSRLVITKQLKLLQAEVDRYFSFCVPNSLFAKLHAIDKKIGGGRELGDRTFVSSQEKDRYLVKSLIQEEAITSSQLEGASTTREVAKNMLEKRLAPKDKSQQMILNNYLLMQKVVERKDDELSIEFILELHEIATHKAIENQAMPGEFRRDNNIFIADIYNENAFYPPDCQTIRERLTSLCDFANSDHNQGHDFIHPILKAIILHFMIAYIHPFGDGNGRTARAIFYWSVLRSGYWLFEYVSISKFIQKKRRAYDTAFLYTETDSFDMTYFLYNQVDVIEKAVTSLLEYIDKKQKDFYEFMGWMDNSPVAKTLKRGQLEILKEALKVPGREFTTKQVAIDFDIVENTARTYLNQLVSKDLLISASSKNSKTVLYIAPANLRARLQI